MNHPRWVLDESELAVVLDSVCVGHVCLEAGWLMVLRGLPESCAFTRGFLFHLTAPRVSLRRVLCVASPRLPAGCRLNTVADCNECVCTAGGRGVQSTRPWAVINRMHNKWLRGSSFFSFSFPLLSDGR